MSLEVGDSQPMNSIVDTAAKKAMTANEMRHVVAKMRIPLTKKGGEPLSEYR